MLNLNNNYTELIKPKNNRSEKDKLNFEFFKWQSYSILFNHLKLFKVLSAAYFIMNSYEFAIYAKLITVMTKCFLLSIEIRYKLVYFEWLKVKKN